jgi:hypothetical protein
MILGILVTGVLHAGPGSEAILRPPSELFPSARPITYEPSITPYEQTIEPPFHVSCPAYGLILAKLPTHHQ